MKRSEFFEQLETELVSSPYSARLREELEAHIEDAMHTAMINGSTEEQAEQETIRSMGTPQQIKTEFQDAMRYQSLWIQIAEIVLITLCSIPLYLMIPFLVSYATQFLLRFHEGTYQQTMLFSQILPFFILIPVTLGCFLLFFRFVLPRYYRLFIQSDKRAIFFLLLLFLPAVVSFITHFYTILSEIPNHFSGIRNDYSTPELIQVISYILYEGVVVNGLALFSGIWTIHWCIQQEKKALHLARTSQLQTGLYHEHNTWMTPIVSTLIVGYIVFTTALQWIYGEHELSQPRAWFEYYILNGISAQWTYEATAMLRAIPFAVLGIVCITGLITLGAYVYKRSVQDQRQHVFPWLSLIAVSYIVSLFCMPVTHTAVEWHVPSVAVSEQIERAQFGPFFRPAQYVYSYSWHGLMHYSTHVNENSFSLYQYPDPGYVPTSLHPEFNRYDLLLGSSLSSYHIQKNKSAAEETGINEPFDDFLYHPFIECVYGAAGIHECKELRWKGKTIFSSKTQVPIYTSTIRISPDEQWMLITMLAQPDALISSSPLPFPPQRKEEVYLVDLSSIQIDEEDVSASIEDSLGYIRAIKKTETGYTVSVEAAQMLTGVALQQECVRQQAEGCAPNGFMLKNSGEIKPYTLSDTATIRMINEMISTEPSPTTLSEMYRRLSDPTNGEFERNRLFHVVFTDSVITGLYERYIP